MRVLKTCLYKYVPNQSKCAFQTNMSGLNWHCKILETRSMPFSEYNVRSNSILFLISQML